METECVVCQHCRQPIAGPFLSAFGHSWHKEHLTCRVCGGDFADRPLYEGKDGHPYCKDDYINTFAPKCGRCGGVIMGKVLTAIGMTWHPHHFTCTQCDSPLVEKGQYGVSDGRPYCPLHTPLSPHQSAIAAEHTKSQNLKRHQHLLSQLDLVPPDPEYLSIEFNEQDPLTTMHRLVEVLTLPSDTGADTDLKRASLGKAILHREMHMVEMLVEWLCDTQKGNREIKSAAIQTLWKMGDIEEGVYRKCGEMGVVERVIVGMVTSHNPEAIYLAATFLGKLCGTGPLPPSQLTLLNESFLTEMLNLIIHYDVEDDGQPETQQSLQVSRSLISCLVGINFQFGPHGNAVLSALLCHSLSTTLASRILTKFNDGLTPQELRVYVKFFADVFDSQSGLFFTSDLKVVIEICVRELQDLPAVPLDKMRRGYVDLVELFLRSGMYEKLDFHRLPDLKKALEMLTVADVADPFLLSRCTALLYDCRSIF